MKLPNYNLSVLIRVAKLSLPSFNIGVLSEGILARKTLRTAWIVCWIKCVLTNCSEKIIPFRLSTRLSSSASVLRMAWQHEWFRVPFPSSRFHVEEIVDILQTTKLLVLIPSCKASSTSFASNPARGSWTFPTANEQNITDSRQIQYTT